MPGRDEDVLARLVREERQDKLRERINQLPAQHRDIITAYYLGEKIMSRLPVMHRWL